MNKKIILGICCSLLVLVAATSYLFYNHYLDNTALARPFNALGFEPVLDERYYFPNKVDVAYDEQTGTYYARNEILIDFFENVTDNEKKEVESMMKADFSGKSEDGYTRMMIPAALSMKELELLCESMPTRSVCIEAAYIDRGLSSTDENTEPTT